jgi:hypothetical protein
MAPDDGNGNVVEGMLQRLDAGKNKKEEGRGRGAKKALKKALKQRKRARPLLEKARRQVGKRDQEKKNVSLLMYSSLKAYKAGKS